MYLDSYDSMEARGETNEQERTEKKVKMSALIQELGKRVECREMCASECSGFI